MSGVVSWGECRMNTHIWDQAWEAEPGRQSLGAEHRGASGRGASGKMCGGVPGQNIEPEEGCTRKKWGTSGVEHGDRA